MNILSKSKRFLLECKRVWQVTKKPSKDEFLMIVKVTGIGMIVIGLIGFILHQLWQVFLA